MPSRPLLLLVDSRWQSPYALSAFVALVEKSASFQTITVDLQAGAQHEEAFASASLTHRVPVLIDGEFSLSESSAIDEYLDEVLPGRSLYPKEPRQRARARQLQAWLRSDLMPIRTERSAEVVFYGERRPPLSPAAAAASRTLIDATEALLPEDADHLFGEWSIADTDLAMMLNRLVLNGDPVPDRLIAYANRQWQRPSVQRWLSQPRPAA